MKDHDWETWYTPIGEPTPGEFSHRSAPLPCVVCGGEVLARPHEKVLEQSPRLPRDWRCVGCMQDNKISRVWRSGIDAPVASKPTNPKDVAAQARAALGFTPLAAMLEESLAYYEGLLKYGQQNWAVAKVRASVYVFATLRHVLKWYWGQTFDPTTNTHHLGNARASLGILLDAEARKVLIDDRPPALPLEALHAMFARAEEVMAKLHNLYGHINPKHYYERDPGE